MNFEKDPTAAEFEEVYDEFRKQVLDLVDTQPVSDLSSSQISSGNSNEFKRVMVEDCILRYKAKMSDLLSDQSKDFKEQIRDQRVQLRNSTDLIERELMSSQKLERDI